MRPAPRLFAAALAFAVAGEAAAAPMVWRVDAAASTLDIIYEIDGKPWRGQFAVFEGEGVFDPNRLETAEMTLVIDTDSIDVGNVFGTAVAKTSDWLDVGGHPEAVFELTRLTPKGGDLYGMAGILTLRGAS
ncbi:MAG: YceI family protein, partial [Pseudomonadota bacterium]